MRKIKLGKNIIIFATILFFIQNFYFGWNSEPINRFEEVTDKIIGLIYLVGWIAYSYPILDLYEEKVKKHEEKK